MKILQNTGIFKAAGVHKVSWKILKDGAEILGKPIGEIATFQSPLKFSYVPEKLQSSNLFLRIQKNDPCNYRPVLLLPVISNFFERVFHNQTNAFLKENSWGLL